MSLTEFDRQLITATQSGLPLVPRPYAAVAEQLGVTEAATILYWGTIGRMLASIRPAILWTIWIGGAVTLVAQAIAGLPANQTGQPKGRALG